MPELHYWFSGAALFLACSFGFAILVGLIGIKEMVSRKLFYILIVIAACLSGLAWHTAAKQEEMNDFVQGSIRRIAHSTNVNPNQSAQSLADEIIKRVVPLKDDLEKAKRELQTLTKRQNDMLYQEGRPVARVAGISIDPGGQTARFQAVTSERELDFSKEMELQRARLKCGSPSGQPNGGVFSGANRAFTYADVTCHFVGPRQ